MVQGELVIPEGVGVIGNYAFVRYDGLTSVKIADSVTSIGEHAFWECKGLKNITIGNGMTSIGDSTFLGCSGLTIINFQGTKAQWEAIEKGSYWDDNTGEYTVHCTDGTISKADA